MKVKTLLWIAFGILAVLLVVKLGSAAQIEGVDSSTVFPKLISNYASVGYGEAVFELNNPTDKKVKIKDTLSFAFVKGKGNFINRYELYTEEIVSYQSPVYEEQLIGKDCNGTDCSYYDDVLTGYETKYKPTWVEVYKLKKINPGITKVMLKGFWKPHLGKQAIDWIPTMTFDEDNVVSKPEWAWWNVSYTYKRLLNCTSMTDGIPLIVNGSNGFTIGGETQYLWTYCRGINTSIYYNNYTDYVIANDTAQLPMEVEQGNGTSYNTKEIWGSDAGDYEAIWHMSETGTGLRHDSTGVYNATTYNYTGAEATTGIIDGADILDVTKIQRLKFPNLDYHALPGYTFEAWALTTNGDASPTYGNDAALNIIGDYSSGVSGGFGITDSNAILRVYDSGFGGVSGTTNVSDGNWHYIVATHQSNESIRIYVDGVLEGTGTRDYHNEDSSRIWTMIGGGYQEYKDTFDGTLDEIRIDDKVRTPLQINQTYENAMGTAGYGDLGAEEGGAANTPPTMSLPAWNQTDAYEWSPINLTSTYVDADGTNGTVYWNCSVNGTSVVDSTSSDVVNGTLTSMYLDNSYFGGGDLINCSVYANDGSSDSAINWSSTLTVIYNTAPVMTAPAWGFPFTVTSVNMTITSNYTDSEGFDGTVYWNCSTNGIGMQTYTDTLVANNTVSTMTFSHAHYTGGDTINCSVYANDGSSDSAVVWTGARYVNTTVPFLTNMGFNLGAVNNATPINCSARFWDADMHTGWIFFNFSVNGLGTLTSNVTGLSPGDYGRLFIDEGNYSTGDYINCSAYASDGWTDAATQWSNTLLVTEYVAPLPFEISSPQANWTYRTSIVNLNTSGEITNPTECWYNLDGQYNFTYTCGEEGFNIEIPYNLGNSTIILYMTNATGTYTDTVEFNINNDFSSGKGFVLFGFMFLLLILPFIFLLTGFKLEGMHTPMKFFLIMLGLACVYWFLHLGVIVAEEVIHYDAVAETFSIVAEVYGYILFAILSYFMIVYLYSLFQFWISSAKGGKE